MFETSVITGGITMKKMLSLFLSMVMIITSVIVPTTISASAAEDVFTDKVDEITVTDLKFAPNSGNRQNTTYESTSPTYSVKFKYLVCTHLNLCSGVYETDINVFDHMHIKSCFSAVSGNLQQVVLCT